MDDTFSSVRRNFSAQASYCKTMGSPFYADLLVELRELLTRDGPIGEVFSTWDGLPQNDAVALRFVAALHYLVITEQDSTLSAMFPPKLEKNGQSRTTVLRRAIQEYENLILDYLERPPQTNEVGRSMVLLGGFLEISKRFGPDIDVFEIGASAGLNMAFDQYYYDAEDWQWGDPNSIVQFKPNWKGLPPPLSLIKVHSRRGCDLSPIDAATQRDRLLSYIWPDQVERFNRIRGAIDYAKKASPKIDSMEASAWLQAQNDKVPKLRPRVFYHSIIWQYFSDAQQNKFRDLMVSIGRNAPSSSPVIWLRLEPAENKHHAELRMNIFSDNKEYLLAESGFHGEWINWSGI